MASAQLELTLEYESSPNRLTVAEAVRFVFDHKLRGLPSARSYRANAAAIIRSIGGFFLDALKEQDIVQLMDSRKGCSPQTIRHDLSLLSNVLNTCKMWKKKSYSFEGFDFCNLILPSENPLTDIKRPKALIRERLVSPDEWSRLMEVSSDRLRDILYFLIDTGQNEKDLRSWTVKNYDPSSHSLAFIRSKTSKKVSRVQRIPLTTRCERIILRAVVKNAQTFLDFSGHESEWYRTRLRAKVTFQKRDLRKTVWNEVERQAGGNPRPASKLLCHVSERTGIQHYRVEEPTDLKPYVRHLEKKFA